MSKTCHCHLTGSNIIHYRLTTPVKLLRIINFEIRLIIIIMRVLSVVQLLFTVFALCYCLSSDVKGHTTRPVASGLRDGPCGTAFNVRTVLIHVFYIFASLK